MGNSGAISQDFLVTWAIRSPSLAVQSHELPRVGFWGIIFIFHLLLPWLLGEAQTAWTHLPRAPSAPALEGCWGDDWKHHCFLQLETERPKMV